MAAKKQEPEGLELDYGGPSAESLAEIPELPKNAKRLQRPRKDPQYTLALLREAQRVTQVDVAHAMKISQAQVSRIEHSIDDGDPQLSSLARYAEAIGGAIEVRVRIGDRSYRVSKDGRTYATEVAEGRAVMAVAEASVPTRRKAPPAKSGFAMSGYAAKVKRSKVRQP